MRAMILAAGLGTRLRPLSYEIPKPAIPVLGRPLCTYNIEFLRRAGIREFILNLHTQPKLLQQRVLGWAGGGTRLRFTMEPVILGTGGGIWNARTFLSRETFVTLNGDTILSFPFASALAFHRERKSLATLVLFPDPAKRYTPVWIDGDGRITGFGNESGEGVRSGFYTGCQLVEPEILSRIPPGKTSCIIRDTYRLLAARGERIHGYLARGSFREFGSPADYLSGTLSLLEERAGEGALPRPDIPGVDVVPPSFVSPRAAIAPGARIGPGAVIEEGASVAAGARVARAILWPGASVAAGEEISGAILTPQRRVPAAS